MTVDNLWHDLKALAETRFITVDSDSDEVLIRSYVRLVSVKSPKVWIAAKSAAKRVFSPEIRQVLACELRRLGRADANDLANELQPDGYPTDTPSIPYRSGIDTQYPIDTVSIPTVPVTVPVLKSPTVGGWVGEDPPPTTCLKHPHGTNEPCGACQTARKANEAWETRRAAQIADERRTRRAAIDACPHCEPTGLRETPAGMTRCTHDPDTFDDEPF